MYSNKWCRDAVARRAVHPIITVVMLVAITIAVSLLVANYLFGVWRVELEKFTVTPMIYTRTSGSNSGEPILNLYIKNDGAKEVVVYKVEIRSDVGSWYNLSKIIVPANSVMNITIDKWKWSGETPQPPSIEPGDRFRVLLYTENMGVLFYEIVFS